ncbi:hypothetical protein AB8J26_000301 [Clostridium perfringens]|uniref:hypothetical protein n=1 Tax=Clostridium perfringens TaxID=1502 RepID=UPI001A28C8DB|nr:hypothetical protein [Clostridium perfringens]ELC8346485.1 hypothetical protein [Clostridium perfringens]ELC8438391.1 hypothetical protein [Clostridium perfringens]HAT4106478.1 hypothetical protein [Clostridium perfringens]HAT4357702.1 hypothetical protein [Clostridium perfringens]
MTNQVLVLKEKVKLPNIEESTLPAIKDIVTSLKASGKVVAEDDEIAYAWLNLPRELSAIPVEKRDELLARMCVAISVGLFDGAINYIWNASIKNLRDKVREFGINAISNIFDRDFDEKKISELKDAELLTICLKLNLISEDGYYFLNQNRDIRNNFSVAHPSSSLIDDAELITFIRRCAKYALANNVNLQGIDINDFTMTIKGGAFTENQYDVWRDRILSTNQTQRDLVILLLYNIFCDPNSGQEARTNALNLSLELKDNFSPNFISDLLNKHNEFQAKGKDDKFKASQVYFKELSMLAYLSEIEIHSILSDACSNLESVHLGYDNFYNEPPFAKRLSELVEDTEVPDTTKNQYVSTVVMCYIGNQYGVSNGAIDYYEEMIKDFSPKEIDIFLRLYQNKNRSIISERIRNYRVCKDRFIEAIGLINKDSLVASQKILMDEILANR